MRVSLLLFVIRLLLMMMMMSLVVGLAGAQLRHLGDCVVEIVAYTLGRQASELLHKESHLHAGTTLLFAVCSHNNLTVLLALCCCTPELRLSVAFLFR